MNNKKYYYCPYCQYLAKNNSIMRQHKHSVKHRENRRSFDNLSYSESDIIHLNIIIKNKNDFNA